MQTTHTKPIIVIADDLTGAAEIAGIGLRYGLTTEVQTAFDPVSDAELIVIDTDTRSGNVSAAARIVRETAALVKERFPHLVYKKTDSVLRGHVAAEIDALAGILGKRSMLLVPANPGMKRIIQGGLYSVNSVPLHETDFAVDPDFPIATSEVASLIDKTGMHAVSSALSPAPVPVGTLVIGDATGTEDLAAWASHIGSDCLPAGGGEFFAAILESTGLKEQGTPPVDDTIAAPALFVSGSMSDYSRMIVAQAQADRMPVFSVPVDLSRRSELNALMKSAAAAIETHGAAMFAVGSNTWTTEVNPRYIPGIVAESVKHALGYLDIRSLCLTGGATAAAVLRRLGWERFTIEAELRQGVCRMSVIGRDDCDIFVKPGSYPWPDTVVKEYFGG